MILPTRCFLWETARLYSVVLSECLTPFERHTSLTHAAAVEDIVRVRSDTDFPFPDTLLCQVCAGARACTLVFDVLAFALTLRKTLAMTRAVTVKNSLISLMLRDGVW